MDRTRFSRALLAPLLVGLLVLAVFAPWHAVNVVDNRTYVEMAAGVRDHGLPYTENTWSDVLPEAAPSFNFPKDGKLWGEYPPLYAYFAAPELALGGLGFLYKGNVLLIAVLAWLIYRIAARTTGNPVAGAAAAWLAVLGTPLWAGSFQTLAMPLTLVCLAAAVLTAIRSLDDAGAARCVLVGLFCGLAVDTHLMALPMVGVLLAALGLADPRSKARPWREAALRALGRYGAAAAGFLPPLALLSALNHVRFGTYNPVTYGPCVWQVCTWMVNDSLNAGSLLRFGGPAVVHVALTAGAAYLARRSRLALVAVLGLGVLPLVAFAGLRTNEWLMLRTVFGYFVDATKLDLSPLPKGDNGVGWFRGPRVVKGLLESSPWLVLALFAAPRLRGPRARVLLVWAPVAGHVAALALFGRFQGAYALGWPYLFCRYALYSAPFLAVLATHGASLLALERKHLLAAVAVALLGLGFLVPSTSDFDSLTRLLQLRGTLVVALGLALAVALRDKLREARHAAPVLLAVACGLAISVSMGVDTATSMRDGVRFDRRLDRFAALTPQRFALAGWGPDTDPLLALRGVRDVHYIDLIETPNWDGFRQIMDKWADDGRPIYGAFPRDAEKAFKWPYADWDVPAELIDSEENYWKIGPPRRRFDAK